VGLAAVFVVLGLLLIWQVLVDLGLIDPVRFSHPTAVLQTFGDGKFLRRLLAMFVQLAVVLFLGGLIGLTIGALGSRTSWLALSLLRFLRIGFWIPFFVFWPLPIWPPKEGYLYDPIIWVWLVSVATVSLSTCYSYLAARFILGLERRKLYHHLLRLMILESFFISLISQAWVGEYGWISYFVMRQGGTAYGYAALLVMVTFLFLIELSFRSSFILTAQLRSTTITKELPKANRRSLWGVFLFVLMCLVAWHLLRVPLMRYLSLASPIEILKAAYGMVVAGSPTSKVDVPMWQHLTVSFVEMSVGLMISGGAALVVRKLLSSFGTFRTIVLPLLPLTYSVPLVVPLLFIHWMGLIGPKLATLVIAFISFYPFIEVLWGFRDRPLFFQILLAVDEALPFAFAGMLFGELWGTVAGLGYFMELSRAYFRIQDGVAVSLMTLLLLVVLSSILRWIVKRLYFSG